MAETRKQIKERLQAAGAWQHYLALRAHLIADGLTAGQAREEALRQIDARPRVQADPATGDQPSEPPPLSAEAIAVSAESPADFGKRIPSYEAAQWVAENIANGKVKADGAPSGLAWGLLQWVRRSPANESTFWGSIWAKTMPSGAALRKQQGEDEHDLTDEKAMKVIDEFLARWDGQDPMVA